MNFRYLYWDLNTGLQQLFSVTSLTLWNYSSASLFNSLKNSSVSNMLNCFSASLPQHLDMYIVFRQCWFPVVSLVFRPFSQFCLQKAQRTSEGAAETLGQGWRREEKGECCQAGGGVDMGAVMDTNPQTLLIFLYIIMKTFGGAYSSLNIFV